MAAEGIFMGARRTQPALPEEHASIEDERQHRKERLAGALRIFGRYGFSEGVAGHITARDPERLDHFWVNPFGMSFRHVRVSDLILVNHAGEVVEGSGALNRAAFVIHSAVHKARPDVNAAAHAHSAHGKAFSSLGRLLDPITQDACAFFEDHVLCSAYGGRIVLEAGPAGEGGFEIRVRDTGVGIAPDQIERVMLPFEQGDNRYSRAMGGTGLGLALVKGLVELHGGSLEIASEPGSGTAVTATFPATPPDGTAAA